MNHYLCCLMISSLALTLHRFSIANDGDFIDVQTEYSDTALGKFCEEDTSDLKQMLKPERHTKNTKSYDEKWIGNSYIDEEEEFDKFEVFLEMTYSKKLMQDNSRKCNYLGARAFNSKSSSSSGGIGEKSFTILSPPWAHQSTLFITGALRSYDKSVGEFYSWVTSKIVENLQEIIRHYSSYAIILYVDDQSYETYKAFNDPCVYFIRETFKHDRRTYRLAHARTLLHKQVGHMIALSEQDPSRAYMVVIDPDEANAYEFKTETLHYVMTHNDEWDAVSFNRDYYYDLWALRTFRGGWDLTASSNIVRMVRESKQSFYPVLSAFNGMAIYKYSKTIGCRYYGRNLTSPAWEGEDCEHVSFHLCMVDTHEARIRIHNESIVSV